MNTVQIRETAVSAVGRGIYGNGYQYWVLDQAIERQALFLEVYKK